MSVSPEILAKSLCNTLGASSVKVKLAKKQSACLSVEIALPSPGEFKQIDRRNFVLDLLTSLLPDTSFKYFSRYLFG